MLAVHLMDQVLRETWVVGGFAVAALLFAIGAWRLRPEEFPRIAVLSAAFFVASSIHVPVPGTSVHLLLNGLMGIILGRRCLVGIPIGLVLQALLLGHGGVSTLGVNACIMELPAMAAWGVFALVKRCIWFQKPVWQSLIGLGLGSLTVLGTSTLNALVLWLGGQEDFTAPAVAAFVMHLPIAAVEGLIMASLLPFLAKVKPEMLGMAKAAPDQSSP